MNNQNLLEDNKSNCDNFPLKNTWKFYFHKIKDNNWNLDSYQLLFSFDNIRDFWKLYNNHPNYMIGLFFLMRESIAPMWEDEQNINGGTYSFKISRTNIEKAWTEISASVIGNELLKDNNVITGISMHPKYNCFIVKIWVKNEIPDISEKFKLEFFNPNTAIYKKNIT